MGGSVLEKTCLNWLNHKLVKTYANSFKKACTSSLLVDLQRSRVQLHSSLS